MTADEVRAHRRTTYLLAVLFAAFVLPIAFTAAACAPAPVSPEGAKPSPIRQESRFIVKSYVTTDAYTMRTVQDAITKACWVVWGDNGRGMAVAPKEVCE